MVREEESAMPEGARGGVGGPGTLPSSDLRAAGAAACQQTVGDTRYRPHSRSAAHVLLGQLKISSVHFPYKVLASH